MTIASMACAALEVRGIHPCPRGEGAARKRFDQMVELARVELHMNLLRICPAVCGVTEE